MKCTLAVFAFCALALMAQDRPSDAKHLAVLTDASPQPVRFRAQEIVRDLPAPGLVHLKGDVEIRTPICIATGPGSAQTCAGYLVLRADAADFHPDSGEIEAVGHVRVTHEK